MHSRKRFVIEGIKQAGFVFGVFILVGTIGFLGAVKGVIVPAFIWIVAFISGPIPLVLILCDITDTQLHILWITFLLPYWVCLGAVAGCVASRPFAVCERSTSSKKTITTTRLVIVTMALAIGLFSFSLWRGFAGGGSALGNGIINNLRQLDAAKQQLALVRNLSEDYVPTEAELAPYLGRGRNGDTGIPHVGQERYVINSIREKPNAVLDSDWRVRRRGWRQGYTITNGTTWQIDKLPPSIAQ
jgi:hypothetical protein